MFDLGRAMPVSDNQPTKAVGPSCSPSQVIRYHFLEVGVKAVEEKEKAGVLIGKESRQGKRTLRVLSSAWKWYLPE